MVRLNKDQNKGVQTELIKDNCKLTQYNKNFLFSCSDNCKYRIEPANHLKRNGLHCAYQKNIDLKDRTETQEQRRARLWQKARRERRKPYRRGY